MKVIITLVFICFCLGNMANHSEKGIQNSKAKVRFKTDSATVKQTNSNSNNLIHINGQLNSVLISNNDSSEKPEAEDKSVLNTIKINGDSNSVNINQNTKAAYVNIQQNGNGNQVNVSQSKNQAIRQEE